MWNHILQSIFVYAAITIYVRYLNRCVRVSDGTYMKEFNVQTHIYKKQVCSIFSIYFLVFSQQYLANIESQMDQPFLT